MHFPLGFAVLQYKLGCAGLELFYYKYQIQLNHISDK